MLNGHFHIDCRFRENIIRNINGHFYVDCKFPENIIRNINGHSSIYCSFPECSGHFYFDRKFPKNYNQKHKWAFFYLLQLSRMFRNLMIIRREVNCLTLPYLSDSEILPESAISINLANMDNEKTCKTLPNLKLF